jgi:hypothetical protein
VSVRVLVILFEAALVVVRVRVGLPVVAVFVFVLDVLMIMQDVRVCMRDIPVRVLVSVLCGHFIAPFLTVSIRRGPSILGELIGPVNWMLHAAHGSLASVSCHAN